MTGDATPVVTEDVRWCLGCRVQWHESAFVGANGQSTTTCSRCLAKQRVKVRRPQQRTPAVIRAQHLRQKYGITVEEYDALRAAQDYRCAICRTHEDDIQVGRVGRPRKDGTPAAEAAPLVVDHCHGSGQVRGLLCNGCNSAIGHFRDSPAAMLSAIRYLRRSSVRPVLTDPKIAKATP